MPFVSWGIANNGTLRAGQMEGNGTMLSGYVTFGSNNRLTVNVVIGVSFISVEQARKNLDAEIPDGTTLEQTAKQTRELWDEKLSRIRIEGASDGELETFYTAFFHTLQVMPFMSFSIRNTYCQLPLLQYPNEQSEGGMYYSGYDQAVHHGVSYTGYSIWVSQPPNHLVTFMH
jgi:putative alpha-1,2-mannosidase